MKYANKYVLCYNSKTKLPPNQNSVLNNIKRENKYIFK